MFFFRFLSLSESVADARLGQRFIQVDSDCFVQTAKVVIISDWSSKDGIKEKRRGLLQYFVDGV